MFLNRARHCSSLTYSFKVGDNDLLLRHRYSGFKGQEAVEKFLKSARSVSQSAVPQDSGDYDSNLEKDQHGRGALGLAPKQGGGRQALLHKSFRLDHHRHSSESRSLCGSLHDVAHLLLEKRSS